MPIRHKPASAIYKLVIGSLSLVTEWFILIQNGPVALRLFPTWVLFLASVYYLASALYLAVSRQRDSGKVPCPVFEGMIIVGFFIMSAAAILATQHHFYLPGLTDWIVWMCCLVLPILTLFDWMLFDEKGRWHPMAPFYWLALPVCYAATMIFSADLLPFGSELVYPLEILDYATFGLWAALEWYFFIALLVLIAGYALYLLDFISSGKLAKAIVLPHIQVIEVDEDDEDLPSQAATPVIKPESTPRSSAKAKNSSRSRTAVTKSTSIDNTKSQRKRPQVERVRIKVSKTSSADASSSAHRTQASQARSSKTK